MKFALLFAAIVAAQDEEAAAEETLEQGADCSAGACGEGLCCGTATETLEEGAEGDAATKTVCNDAAATDFVDEEDPDIAYTFACNPSGEEGAAVKLGAALAASVAVVLNM